MNNSNSFNWSKWQKIIGGAVNAGKSIGLSDKSIESSAKRIGNFIALTTEPDSEAEKLFLNLWKSASNDEKKVLSRLLIRTIDDSFKS